MSVQVIIFEHPFKSERRIEHVAPDKIKNILLLCRELPEQFEYSIIKNDLVATLEDETVDGDNLIIRAIPAGGLTKKEGENIGVGKMFYGAGLIIVGALLSMTVVGAPLGASLMAWGFAVAFTGVATIVGSQFLPKEESSVNTGSGTSRPNIRGASNSANPDGKLPLVLGKHLLTPYYATTPFTEIENSAASGNNSGQRLYYNVLFALGYAPLKISNIKVGETVVASGSFTSAPATPTTLTFDGPYAGLSGTFVNGALPSSFTYVKKEEQLNMALDALNFKSFTLDIVVNASAYTFTAPVNTKLDLSEDDGGYGIQIGDMVYFTNFANAGNKNYFLVTNLLPGAGSSYNNVMLLSSSSVGLVNETKSGATGSAAPSNIVTTPKNTTAIKVIITFPSGLCSFTRYGKDYNNRGTGNNGVKVKAYYRAVGTFNWTEMPYFQGGTPYLVWFMADSTVRFQSEVTGLTTGEYEVRVARESGKFERDNTTFYDNVEWSILQCTTSEKVWDDASVANVSFLHLRFLATTALANSISKISLIAESVYTESVTGANWTEDASYLYSPASAFLWALTGPYNPRPLTGADRTTYIDYTSVEAWRDYCATIVTGSEQMHTCNAVMTDSINLQDFLNNICSTGRAFFTMVDGKYSVVWDAPTTTVIQHITPRNSWNFQGNKTFDEVPALMQVSFIDADNEWAADEYDIWENGGSASSTPREAVTSWGVTSYKEICRNMRYVMACLKLRPETFSVYMDAEQLACTIGDRVQVSHDAMLVGYSWGRVKTVTLNEFNQVSSFTTDEPVSMSTGLSYVVRTRNVSGMLYADVNTVVGESNELVFTTPQVAGSVTVGDLFQFGEENIESIPCIISGIEMQEDLSAKLSLILYDEDVYASDSVTPPAFTSKISKKPIFYTSTVTTEVARQAISEVAGIDIPAATGIAELATASKRPRYIGKYLDILPTSSNENDWVLSYSTIPANRFVAYWYIDPLVEDDPGAWTGITNPTAEQITAMWSDLCWVSNQTSGGSPLYVTTIGDISEYIGSSINFIEVLGANLAFVNQLFANYLKVTNTLRIGDRYDQDGTIIDSTKDGIFFDGATGQGKMAGISFEGAQGGGVQWGSPNKIGTGLTISGFGTPALTALSGTQFAYIDSANDVLKKYQWNGSTFVLVGTGLSISGANFPAIAALNSTDVAFIDFYNADLRLYRWGGTTFSQIGSDLSLSGVGLPALAALNGTDIALIDSTDDELRLYRWNTSTLIFEQVGSSLTISASGNPALTSLNDTDIAFVDNTSAELRLYRWNTSTLVFEQVGSSLPVVGFGRAALAALNGTDIALIDSTNDELRLYRWNTSTLIFEQVGSVGNTGISGGNPALTALNGTDVVYIDGANCELRKYQFSFALSIPHSRTLTG